LETPDSPDRDEATLAEDSAVRAAESFDPGEEPAPEPRPGPTGPFMRSPLPTAAGAGPVSARTVSRRSAGPTSTVAPSASGPTAAPDATSISVWPVTAAGGAGSDAGAGSFFTDGVWVPAGRTVHVSVAATGSAAARIWGPQTVRVNEGVQARRRGLA